MAKKPKQYDDDDGRTIVDMNVEGMPWHDKDMKRGNRTRPLTRAERKELIENGEMLSGRESFRYGLYAVLAGLTVVGFIGGGVCLLVFILWLFWK